MQLTLILSVNSRLNRFDIPYFSGRSSLREALLILICLLAYDRTKAILPFLALSLSQDYPQESYG